MVLPVSAFRGWQVLLHCPIIYCVRYISMLWRNPLKAVEALYEKASLKRLGKFEVDTCDMVFFSKIMVKLGKKRQHSCLPVTFARFLRSVIF